jgi:hypothetical protein
MPDVQISASVSRELLGLAPLLINEHITYYAAPQFLGGQVQWSRTTAGSPWLNGTRTTSRVLEMVTEQLTIEVKAPTTLESQVAMATLIAAFQQDSYTLTVEVDGEAIYSYLCESADYQVVWMGPRLVSKQGQATFSVPRQPVPLQGGV